MAEYINRERARFEFERFFKAEEKTQNDCDSLLCMLPSADVVEVVHAHWIKGRKEKLYFAYDMSGVWDTPLVCSNCKIDVTEYGYEETPFCPFCGAKMDGDKNG